MICFVLVFMIRFMICCLCFFLWWACFGKVQILAEDLAKPLREKMGSAQYTDVLLATCFQETVDATKVNGEQVANRVGKYNSSTRTPSWYCTVFPMFDYSYRCPPPPAARLPWLRTLLAEIMGCCRLSFLQPFANTVVSD